MRTQSRLKAACLNKIFSSPQNEDKKKTIIQNLIKKFKENSLHKKPIEKLLAIININKESLKNAKYLFLNGWNVS